jgi:hypothetical protein
MAILGAGPVNAERSSGDGLGHPSTLATLAEAKLEAIFLTVGRLAGALGVLLTLAAGGARLAGQYWLASYSAGTVLLAGIALMLIGALGFLAALTLRRGADIR